MRVRYFSFPVLVFAIFFARSTSAAPKDLSALFPNTPNLDTSKLYTRSSPEYAKLMDCQNHADKATYCEANGIPRFYDLSDPAKDVDDTFDYMNRCVGVLGFRRYAKDFANGAAVPAKALKLTPTTVDCPGVTNEEVVEAHLVACYTTAGGAYCAFASTCFQGPTVEGKCPRDYPAETIYISRNGANPAPAPTLGVLCTPTWCHLNTTYTTTCYTNGTHTAAVAGGPCAAEDGGSAALMCTNPAFCTGAGPGPGPTVVPTLAANDWCFYGAPSAFGLPNCSGCPDGGAGENSFPSLACPKSDAGAHVTRCGPVTLPISGSSPCAPPGSPPGCAGPTENCFAY